MDAEAGRNIAGAQAMIAPNRDVRIQPQERACTIVFEHSRPAVNRLGRALDRPPGLLENRLMAEANAEHGNLARGTLDLCNKCPFGMLTNRAGNSEYQSC